MSPSALFTGSFRVQSWHDSFWRWSNGKGSGQPLNRRFGVIIDILIALLITAIAIALGVTVHPLLFFLIVLAVVYFFARHRTRTAGGRY